MANYIEKHLERCKKQFDWLDDGLSVLMEELEDLANGRKFPDDEYERLMEKVPYNLRVSYEESKREEAILNAMSKKVADILEFRGKLNIIKDIFGLYGQHAPVEKSNRWVK